jgi:hypothetical protein
MLPRQNLITKEVINLLYLLEEIRGALHDLLGLPIKDTEKWVRKIRSQHDIPSVLLADHLDVDRKTAETYQKLPAVVEQIEALLKEVDLRPLDTRVFELARRPVTMDRLMTELREQEPALLKKDVQRVVDRLVAYGSLTKQGYGSKSHYCSTDLLFQVTDDSISGVIARRARCLAIAMNRVTDLGGVLSAELDEAGVDHVRNYIAAENHGRAARSVLAKHHNAGDLGELVNTGVLTCLSEGDGFTEPVDHVFAVLTSAFDANVEHVATRATIRSNALESVYRDLAEKLPCELALVINEAQKMSHGVKKTYTLSFMAGRFDHGLGKALGNL